MYKWNPEVAAKIQHKRGAAYSSNVLSHELRSVGRAINLGFLKVYLLPGSFTKVVKAPLDDMYLYCVSVREQKEVIRKSGIFEVQILRL